MSGHESRALDFYFDFYFGLAADGKTSGWSIYGLGGGAAEGKALDVEANTCGFVFVIHI